MDKVRVIERSLRCYFYGWVSLIPLLGLPMLVLAVVLYQQVRIEAGREWNPANRYLHCGLGLACFGGLLSIGLFCLMLIRIANT